MAVWFLKKNPENRTISDYYILLLFIFVGPQQFPPSTVHQNIKFKGISLSNPTKLLEITFTAGGDYNKKQTHWASTLITSRGRELLKTLKSNNYEHLSTGVPA